MAKVHRIEIMTKLRTIDVGDVEILEVLGYDKEGNVFSTLEGMRFEWTIQTDQASNLELVSLKVIFPLFAIDLNLSSIGLRY